MRILGSAVAALGSDRVVIGAPHADAAYLFNTNGTLLATFSAVLGFGFGQSAAASKTANAAGDTAAVVIERIRQQLEAKGYVTAP
jgi:hypothetical protein